MTQTLVKITDQEKQQFLKNSAPVNITEAYICFAVQNCIEGLLFLFADELNITAVMARQAGLPEFAERIESKMTAWSG